MKFSQAMDPAFSDLLAVSTRLRKHGIEHALGGSGLLYFLGIDVAVHDWDFTTDAPADSVRAALSDLALEISGPQGKYQSRYLCRVIMPTRIVEVIGAFAIRVDGDLVPIRTRVVSHADGIPLGCPQEWLRAYRAMGDAEKAALLSAWLTDD